MTWIPLGFCQFVVFSSSFVIAFWFSGTSILLRTERCLRPQDPDAETTELQEDCWDGWGMGLQLNNDCVCKAWVRWGYQDRIRCDVICCMLRWYQHWLELCLELAGNCSNELTVDFSPLMISSLIQMFWIWVHEKSINWLAWDPYFNIRLKVMNVSSEKQINDKRFELL